MAYTPKDKYSDYNSDYSNKPQAPSEKKFRMVIKFKVTGAETPNGVLVYDTVAKNLAEAFVIATKLCEVLSSDGRTGEPHTIKEIDTIKPSEIFE